MGVAIIAILFGLLTNEIWAHLPMLQNVILRAAVALFPRSEQPRYLEEWRADLLEFRGELTRTLRAVGFLHAGLKCRVQLAWNPWAIRTRCYVPILDERKYGVMVLSDLIMLARTSEEGIFAISDFKFLQWTTLGGEERFAWCLAGKFKEPPFPKIWQLPGASPAWHPYQRLPMICWLRQVYSNRKYKK